MPTTAHDSRDKVHRLQQALYQAAKRSPRRRFHALYDKLGHWVVLERAWATVRANRGQGGVDGQTIERIEQAGVEPFLRDLQAALRAGRYRPCPVRRVEIPKASGGTRLLGIPTIRDRVVQAACRLVIDPLFEADFLPCSYGFRVGRSAQQAHRLITQTINRGHNWVIDGDIARYFDTIDHGRLRALVRQRVSDRRVLRLVRAWLKAGVLTAGGHEPTEQGTPQGGVISPLLSNIYLHVLDQHWQQHSAHLGTLVRYADDFVILCRRYQDARASLAVVRTLLAHLGLRLHPEKTRVVDLYRGKAGFDFLGFHFHKCASWQYRGKHYCLSWPSQRAMRQIRRKVKAVTTTWRRLPFPIASVVASLNPILRGWVTYFRIGNSSRHFGALDRYVFDRLALFRRRKFHLRRRAWPAADYQRLGVYRAAGRVAWA